MADQELRVLISAGGTAGHVLPALTVLRQLTKLTQATKSLDEMQSTDIAPQSNAVLAVSGCSVSGVQALFVGEETGMEHELVSRENVTFATIRSGAINGVGAWRATKGMLRVLFGIVDAFKIVGRFRPDVVFLTGGFVGVPVSVAAWMRRVPVLLYLPDIEPGMAFKLMARFATKIATTTEASGQFIPSGKMVVTGYPVREAFYGVDRTSARPKFGIGLDERVVLVFGGSKGARSINRAITAELPALLQRCVLIHVSGANDWEEVSAAREALPEDQRKRYLAFKYLHEEMADAMVAADLTVCRSGASALGELPFVGLPAVLVPYPWAWRFQKVNAAYLAERGAARVLEDGALTAAQGGLVDTVTELLDAPIVLEKMRDAARSLARRNGATEIAGLVMTSGQQRACR